MSCSDFAVNIDQVLGTAGDISFDESGQVALAIGQTSVPVGFQFEKETSDYRFEYLYIKDEDGNPLDIRPVLNSQSTTGFVVLLTGTPVTVNSILYWRVVVPDALHACQSYSNGPRYAIVPPPQTGVADFPEGQDFIEVVFPVAQSDSTWEFEALSLEDAGADIPQTFSMPTVVVHTQYGFKLVFAGSPDHDGITLRWRIA